MTLDEREENINTCRMIFEDVVVSHNVCICKDKERIWHVFKVVNNKFDEVCKFCTSGMHCDADIKYTVHGYWWNPDRRGLYTDTSGRYDRAQLLKSNEDSRNIYVLDTEKGEVIRLKCSTEQTMDVTYSSIQMSDNVILFDSFGTEHLFLYNKELNEFTYATSFSNRYRAKFRLIEQDDCILVDYISKNRRRADKDSFDLNMYTVLNKDYTLKIPLVTSTFRKDKKYALSKDLECICKHERHIDKQYYRVVYDNGVVSSFMFKGVIPSGNKNYDIVEAADSNKMGIIDKDGNLVVDMQYNSIQVIDNQAVALYKTKAYEDIVYKMKTLSSIEIRSFDDLQTSIISNVKEIRNTADGVPITFLIMEDDSVKVLYNGKYVDNDLSNIAKRLKVYYNNKYNTTYKIYATEQSIAGVIVNQNLDKVDGQYYIELNKAGWTRM